MFDRLVEDFCQFDDFCQGFYPRWEARLLTQGARGKKRGPEAGLAKSEIMTIPGAVSQLAFQKLQDVL